MLVSFEIEVLRCSQIYNEILDALLFLLSHIASFLQTLQFRVFADKNDANAWKRCCISHLKWRCNKTRMQLLTAVMLQITKFYFARKKKKCNDVFRRNFPFIWFYEHVRASFDQQIRELAFFNQCFWKIQKTPQEKHLGITEYKIWKYYC